MLFRSLGRLAGLNGGREVLAEAAEVFAGGPAGITAALQALTDVADAVTARAPGVTLHFDLCELHGYHYHTGLVFAAYAPGQGEALANGGRYDDIGQVFGRARPATGFNTDLKALLRLARGRRIPQGDAVWVPCGLAAQAWEEIRRLRDAGECVLAGLPGEARPPRCSRELQR